MKVGDKLRVTKKKDGKAFNETEIRNRTARVYALDNKITVVYRKDGQDMHRESFSYSDILAGSVNIEIWENKKWRRITKEDFKEVS